MLCYFGNITFAVPAAESLQPYLDALAFLRTAFTTGVQINARKISISTQVIGLVKKMLKLPPERINALRMLFSRSGASTKDNSIGADGKLFLFKRYPTMPDKNITMTPYMELLVL